MTDVLDHYLEQFKSRTVICLGDPMLDIEVFTEWEKPGYEEKGDIYREMRREHYPGGACNVAVNLASLGAQVTFLGPLGHDPEAECLEGIMSFWGIKVSSSLRFDSRPCLTTTKTRIYQNGAPLFRLDWDQHAELTLNSVDSVLNRGAFDLLLISDYQKGALGKSPLLDQMIRLFRDRNPEAKVAINPKPRTARDLCEPVDLLSVNDTEYKELLRDCPTLLKCERPLKLMTDNLLHTLGAQGLELTTREWEGRKWPLISCCIPPVVDPDVVGCGDATFAAASLALTVSPDPIQIARIGAAAGAAKAGKKGTQPVNGEDIRQTIQAAKTREQVEWD